MTEITDQQLLQNFKAGNKEQAFEMIVKKYQERLYWHIRKIIISHDDTDDVLQNVFIKVWNGLQDFRGDAQIFTWLYRIATNESITFLNSKRTKFLVPIVNVEKQLSETLETDPFFNGDEIQKKLQKAILTLPEKQRIVFNMKYFEEMKYEEMSEILETSVGALKSSYHYAVQKIEKYFEINQ